MPPRFSALSFCQNVRVWQNILLQLALLGFDMPIRYQSKVPAKFSSICQVSRLIAKRPDMQIILAKKRMFMFVKMQRREGNSGTLEYNTILCCRRCPNRIRPSDLRSHSKLAGSLHSLGRMVKEFVPVRRAITIYGGKVAQLSLSSANWNSCTRSSLIREMSRPGPSTEVGSKVVPRLREFFFAA